MNDDTTRELVAAHQGAVTVSRDAALRLAWGLAAGPGYRPWESGLLGLPELPATVLELHDIPRAVSVLGSDGRYDSEDQRGFWRPDFQIIDASGIWRPLELATLPEGRVRGRREILIELHDGCDATVSWHSGHEGPSRFIGRAVASAIYADSDRHPVTIGIVASRPLDPGVPFPVPIGGAL